MLRKMLLVSALLSTSEGWAVAPPSKPADWTEAIAPFPVTDNIFYISMDRFFIPEVRNVPAYLLQDPRYGGGLAPQIDNPSEGQAKSTGWVARQWSAAVRQRS